MQRLALGIHKIVYCLLAILASAGTYASTFDGENLALLDVVFDRQFIGDGVDVYIDGEFIFMPLVDLTGLLELDIDVGENGANGKIAGDDSPFVLSYSELEGWTVSLNSGTSAIDDALIKKNEDVIYIDRSLALQWFGTDFELDFNDSYLHLSVTKLLPFQERLLRHKREINSSGDYGLAEQPALKLPYALWEIPSVDVRANYLTRRHESEDREDFSSVFYAARTYGDLLGMSAQTFWTGRRDEGLKGASIEFNRFDSSRSMGGFLGLSQLSLGDLSHPTLPLAPGSYGRGVILGNDIVSGDSSRNVRDIEGDYYPGWEVELYLNEAIVAFQTIGEDGHYSFKDIVLFQGENEFILKFYGPNGQVEEKTERINVGASSGDGKAFYYTLSVSQPDRKLYEIGDDEIRAETADDIYQATLTTRYAPNDFLSIQLGAQETNGQRRSADSYLDSPLIEGPVEVELDDEGIKRQYYSLELQASLDSHSLSVSTAKQDGRDVSYLYRLGGNLGGMTYRLDYHDYGSFKDTGFGTAIQNFYGASFSQRYSKSSFVLRMSRSENELQYSDYYRLGVSGSVSRVNWSNGLIYENTVYNESVSDYLLDQSLESLSGAFILSTSVSSFIARFTTSYDIIPESQLSKLNLSTSYRLYAKANVNFDVSHGLVTNSNQYRLGLNWQLRHFQITPSVIYNDDGQWQGQVQLSTSLGKRTGRLGSYYDLASDPSTSKGAVRAKLFEDLNRDGQYQLGEPLLSGGEVRALQARRKGRSNRAGVAWLDAMQPWNRTDIVVKGDALEAGAMALTREPFSLTSRPGKVVELDLPFTRVGDFDGVVYEIIDEIQIPIRGVTLLLINESGKQVSRQVTDTDGYFDFSRLMPGDYTLDVEGAELIGVTPEKISILPTGNYVSGVEVVVKRVASEAPVEMDYLPASGSVKPSSIGDDSSLNSQPKKLPPPAFGNPAPVPEIITVNIESIDENISNEKFVEDIDSKESADFDRLRSRDETVEKNVKLSDSIPDAGISPSWSLQAGSFSSRVIADNFSTKLKSEGYNPLIVPVSVKNENYFRVLAVGFTDRSSALSEKNKLDSLFKIKSLVVKY